MQNTSLLDEFSILLSDDSLTRLELFDSWLPGITTRFALSGEEIDTRFDSTVALTFLSHSLLDQCQEEFKKAILNRNPYCQLVLILPRQSFVSPFEDSYDACLRRPIFKDELQTTVEQRFKCGVYSATLYEFYHLNANMAGITATVKEASANELPDEAISRYRQLKQRLDILQPMIDSDDVSSILQSVKLHKRHLTEPDENTDSGDGSKYQPDRCPQCKLPWGVNHRNELGNGFDRVGAFVWKCARCRKLVHGVGSSHRRIA